MEEKVDVILTNSNYVDDQYKEVH